MRGYGIAQRDDVTPPARPSPLYPRTRTSTDAADMSACHRARKICFDLFLTGISAGRPVRSQSCNLGLQSCDSFIARYERSRNVGSLESLWNVLCAIAQS